MFRRPWRTMAHQAGFKIVHRGRPRSFRECGAISDGGGDLHVVRRCVRENSAEFVFDYLLIVTRGHSGDMRVLAWAVGRSARVHAAYIGMMGSKRKVISVYQGARKRGIFRRDNSNAYTRRWALISAR